MTYSIYAPSIHLFAFHLCEDSTPEYSAYRQENYNPNLLWDKCNQEIFPKLSIETQLEIIQEPSGSRVDLLKDKTNKNPVLPLEGEIEYNSSLLKITGLAQPLRIYDSYALWLNIRRPSQENNQKTAPVDLSILRKMNPGSCLLPSSIQSSLGQTLLITAWATEHQNDRVFIRDLADQCVQAFLDIPLEKCPVRRQEGQLFGSPIFEYGLLSQGEDYNHIIVWIFCQGRTDEKLEKCYQQIIDLFFYFNKIIQAYQNSKSVYTGELKKAYENIERKIYRFQTLPDGQAFSQKDIDDLEFQLKTLPKTALEYSIWLRYLEEYQLTITINSRNYIEKLQQIENQMLNEKLTFLETFSSKNCPYFIQQIQAYLGYSGNGLGLVDKAIASIRGLVEIEQARIERERIEGEKKREVLEQEKLDKQEMRLQEERARLEQANKDLQNEIQAIGVGIAAGTIVASSSELMVVPWKANLSAERDSYFHPFLLSILLSTFVAVSAWWITKQWQQRSQ